MYVLRFVRKDRQPPEKYYYNQLEDGMYHLSLFVDDDSGLYEKIELVDYDTNKPLHILKYS